MSKQPLSIAALNAQLKNAVIAKKAASDLIVDALSKLYPVHSRVAVRLMHGQINPTFGTVFGHCDWANHGGAVRVKIDNAKKHSRYSVRDISPDDILWAVPA